MESTVVGKTQCPECALQGRDTSQDNLVLYENGGEHCFACGYTKRGDGTQTNTNVSTSVDKEKLRDV